MEAVGLFCSLFLKGLKLAALSFFPLSPVERLQNVLIVRFKSVYAIKSLKA